MAHGDGVQQPSCATVPLGKSVRRALRTAMGIPKKKKKPPPPPPCISSSSSSRDPGVSMELSSSSSVAARKEAVVRVVMRGGVVEVYPGVVLACTVIRNHPPGLCLAHPDVFRNPHGAVVRPLEPPFPGQKFLLLPETTVVRLKQKIPESSIGAFADDDDDDEDEEEEEDNEAGDGAVVSSSEEEAAAADAEGDGTSSMPECNARDYFVANDRWSEYRFRKLVEQGLAVAPSNDDDGDEPAERKQQEKTRAKKAGNKKTKRKPGRRRRDRPLPQLPMGLRGFAAARRTWEPSLPSVEEEETTVAVSPRHPPSEPEETTRSIMSSQ